MTSRSSSHKSVSTRSQGQDIRDGATQQRQAIITINTESEYQNQEIIASEVATIEAVQVPAQTRREVVKLVNPTKDNIQTTQFSYTSTEPGRTSDGFIGTLAGVGTLLVPFTLITGSTDDSPIPLNNLGVTLVGETSGSGLLGGGVFFTPTGSSSPQINLARTTLDQDSSYFGANSLLFVPINPELAEKTVGLPLLKWEKPRVLGVISEIFDEGFSRNNIIFIKKLISPRASVKKYVIYRKNSFKENDFSVLKELTLDELEPSDVYQDLVAQIGFETKNVFIYRDINLKKNTNYIYKIEAVWIATGPQPVDFNISNIYGNITSGSILFNILQ